jgi:FkbM family methyltransferase
MKKVFRKIKRELVAGLSKIRLRKVTSNYFGLTLKVPVVYGVINGGYIVPAETWMGDCLRTFIDTKRGCVLDIGVNVGLFLVKLRVISKDVPYYGFEPNPSCILYTQELIRLNNFKHATLIPIALSDKEHVATFFAANIGDETGTLIKAHKKGETLDYSFDVFTMRGDMLIPYLNIDELAAIKIDVEEAEINVIHGLEETIGNFRPYIYCEILNVNDDKDKISRAKQICEFILARDYRILGVTNDTRELKIIESIDDVGVAYWQEYVFCPDECVNRFVDSIKHNTSNVVVTSEILN